VSARAPRAKSDPLPLPAAIETNMSTPAWIACFIVQAIWWLWLARWGGARAVEGWSAAWLLHPVAWRWNADAIRVFAWLSLLASTLWFVFGLFVPASRSFFF
jgi:hypothetical protein